MDGSIRLSVTDRKTLFEIDRRGIDPEQRRPAHFLLLLGDGVAWVVIKEVLDTSKATIKSVHA